MNAVFKRWGEEFRLNWKSGLSVGLVNVPMSLALAIASGAGPTAGIITAIWAGLMAAIFGGSHFNIVGPAGALSGILAGYALVYGPQVLPVVAFVSGLVVLAVWLLKWDRYIVFIPSSVIHGFTLSVALVIGLGQLNFALGLSNLPKHERLLSNIAESFRHIGATHMPTFVVFLIGLALMFAILKFRPKWPNSVIVAIAGIFTGIASNAGWIPFALQTIQTKYGEISLSLFNMMKIDSSIFNPTILKAVPLVAVIIVLETLLSAKIADGQTKTKFKQSKEVFGVGIANIVSGFFGGLPATGVFARTALNIKSGARSRYSAIINTFVVVLICFAFLKWFSFLPLATVASILVYLACRMITKEHFLNLFRFDKTAFGIAIATAALSLIYDPLIGILFGSVVSLLVFVNYLSKSQCELEVGKCIDTLEESRRAESIATPDQESADGSADHAYPSMRRMRAEELDISELDADTLIYRFVGELNYMNAEKYKALTEKVLDGKQNIIIFNFRNLFYVDVDGLDAIDEIIEELQGKGKKVYLAGISRYLEGLFLKKHWYLEKVNENAIFDTAGDAMRKLGKKEA